MKRKIKQLISHLYTSGVHTDLHEITTTVLNRLGLSDEWTQYVDIEVKNMTDKEEFKKTKNSDISIFLPHCLRDSKDCQGEYGEKGLECKRCGNCVISEIIEKADELGYEDIYIVPGGSLVKKIINEKEPEAVIGVACYEELTQAIKMADKEGIPSQGILLTEDGCVDTETNKFEVFKKLNL
ncbi:MAG: Metal binding protein, component of redox complex [Candidatus Methanohalarchaeum thermophilum]|uniref:Metal binding protein, component of redox complex n=1 Tax=Methanohalarchaeum thermophilum TaxID=1903181 RepID=A0A1Q6DTL3_METT1|nr:MAG: Metal binding protein, component of redox complex [Candidatus Methanohalarchaeum thermophilum]